jgi:starch synthase
VVNILKGAIDTSDRVLTVSRGYAREIVTAQGGKGLEAGAYTRPLLGST